MFVPMKTFDNNWQSLKEENKSKSPIDDKIIVTDTYNQRLTTFHNPLNVRGAGQFVFDIGKNPNRLNVKLNFSWGNVGPGSTYTLNRFTEELAAHLRLQNDIHILRATSYLPETQDFQPWCQFVEVRQGWHNPIMCYVIWNGETIIPSIARMTERAESGARDWTFSWKNSMTLDQALATLQGEL